MKKLGYSGIGDIRGWVFDKALIIHSGDIGYLRGCLRSLVGYVGEVYIGYNGDRGYWGVVKDLGGSVSGLRVVVKDLGGFTNFADLRNRLLGYVGEGELVLQIDSDERLEVSGEMGLDNADGWRVKVCGYSLDGLGHKVYSENYIFRAYRYRKGIGYRFKVHEQIAHNFVGLRVKKLDGVRIVHLGYDKDDVVLYSKVRRNIRLLREEIAENGKNGYMLYQLGQSLLYLVGLGCGDVIEKRRNLYEGIECLRAAYSSGDITNPELLRDIKYKIYVYNRLY